MEQQEIKRNQWGAMTAGIDENAKMILADALLSGTLDPEYCDCDRKHRGSALNYDIYDYIDDAALIQARYTTMDKYGNHPQKEYYLLIRVGNEVVKTTAPHKMAIARAANLRPPVGHIIKKITKRNTADEIFALLIAAQKMGAEVAA